MFASATRSYCTPLVALGIVVSLGILINFGISEVSSTETIPILAPPPVVEQPNPGQLLPDLRKSPPSDLLFDSIRKELSVHHESSESTSHDHPWDAVESLLKAARKLEQQAAQIDKAGDAKKASLFRSKCTAIRGIAVELMLQTQPSTSQ